MYNINGVFRIVLLGVCLVAHYAAAQPDNTSENYKKTYKKAQHWLYKRSDSTQFFATQALLVAKSRTQRADIYYLLGKMARTQEWTNSAIHYFQKALKLYEKDENKNKVRLALITPYRRQKKYNTALRLARWVNQYLKKKKDSANLKDNYSSLGNIFFNLSQVDTFSVKWTDSSIYYHKKAITLCRQRFPESLPDAYYNFSFAYETISPDSAIYYTKLALNDLKLNEYDQVLFNIRLAQIHYRKKAYKVSNHYLNLANRVNFSDLNLRFMYYFYKGANSLNLQRLADAKTQLVQCDSMLSLMSHKAQNIVDKKGMNQTATEVYGEISSNALKVYEQTKDKAYLEIRKQYQAKKEQTSQKYQQTNQLIVQNDSLLLHKSAQRLQASVNSATDTRQMINKPANYVFFVSAVILLIIAWVVWGWIQQNRSQHPEKKQSYALNARQGLSTDVLSTLAARNEYEKIFSLLTEHLGTEIIAKKTKDLLPGQSFTTHEKVYLVLKAEGFSSWEIGQMLDQTKRNIGEWDKKIKQKVKTTEKPD